MNEAFFADSTPALNGMEEEERRKKKKSKKGEGEKKSKKKSKKSGSDRMRSSSNGKRKKKRKSKSRERNNSRHRERRDTPRETSLFQDQNVGGIQSQDGSTRVPNLSQHVTTSPAHDFKQPLKQAAPTRKPTVERTQKRSKRKKEATRQIVADDTMSKDSTVGMSRGSSKNSLTPSLEIESAWPGCHFQDSGKPGAVPVSRSFSNAPRNAKSSGMSLASSSADSYGSSRVGAFCLTGGAQNGKRGPSVTPSSESCDTRTQRPGAVSVANAAPRGKGNPGPRYKSGLSRVGAVFVSSAAPRGKGGPRISSSSDGYGNQASRAGAFPVASAAPRRKEGPSIASSSDGYGQQVSRVGAFSVSSAVTRVKGGNSLQTSGNADPRVDATSVTSAAPQGKRGSPRSSTAAVSSRVGAISMNKAAARGKGSRPSIASSAESYEPTSPRVGAMPGSGAAPEGKRSAHNTRSLLSSTIGTLGTVSTIGAVSVNSAAPTGKGGLSIASSAEHYDDASQLGAFSVSSTASQDKGRRGSNGGSVTPCDSAVGATSVVSGAFSRLAKGSGPSLREGAEDYSASGSLKKSFRSAAQSVYFDEGAASRRGSVDTSASSQKGRVSHFPTSDFYASMSSMNEGTNTENKGRISQFPGEDQYEEEIEQQSTRFRASVPPGSSQKGSDNGPAYSASEEQYDTPADNRTDNSFRIEAAHHLSRDRSVRSGISAALQGSDPPPRRGSTGAFYISDGSVEGRQPARITASNHDFDYLLEADVTPSAAFPEGPAAADVQVVSSADLKVTPFYCSQTFILLTIIFSVGGIVGAVLGIMVFGGNSSNPEGGPASPTASPTKPVDLERQAAIRTVLLGATDEATLDDPTSPQNAAYDWIVVDDMLSPVNPSGAVTEESEKVLSRYSLAVFYFATHGEGWFASEGWIDGERDECDWEFLSCDNPLNYVDKMNTAGRATGINILGSIPSEISELSALIEFTLPTNKIGAIHPDMRLLSNLKRLDLSNNKLTGSFPEFIYGMTSLLFLDFSRNFLNGTLSSSVSSLSNLGQLILRSNDLSGTITSELAGLRSLRELNLSFNAFAGDFHTIVDGLKNLAFIVLENNRLTGNLNGAKLLAEFEDLAELTLAFNEMDGAIPPELGSLPLLRQIVFDNNRFTGTIPSDLASGAPLQNLILDFNNFDGSVPQTLCSIPTLEIIRVDCNIPCPCSMCLLCAPD